MEKFFKSGEVAKILGVSKKTLAVWEKSGKLIPDMITEKGYKFYSEKTVTLLKNNQGNTLGNTFDKVVTQVQTVNNV